MYMEATRQPRAHMSTASFKGRPSEISGKMFQPMFQLHVPLRLLCGVLLFVCNAVMWTFFSKALRHCSSSARATVTTTASNFVSSAVLGRLIFGETHASLWWLGICLTLCGLLVLHGATTQKPFPHSMNKQPID
uniref:EamA domain-containing protein n=1 Tax=Cynoglossus semilaevis TaxID=244447 RepID=A0A3P8W282_CYNSE